MLYKNKWITLSIILIAAIGMCGCSHKYYRNKPSLFLPTQNIILDNNNSKNIRKDDNSTIIPYCMDTDEEIIMDANKTAHGKCDGYYVVDASKIMLENNATEKREIVNRLLLISNDNCRRFVDKFYYLDLMGKSTFKILSLDLFNGIGLKLGGVDEFTTSELFQMHKTLQSNLKYRSKLRKDINASDDNVSMAIFLNQIREYDHACGLLIREDILLGDTNITE